MSIPRKNRTMAWLFATLCFVVPLTSLSLQQTKRRKTTKKPHDRFVDWASRSQNQNNDRLLLLVDGNNVRGIGKFEWNAIELQHRIAGFCHKYQVPNAVVVWDHGSDKFACSRQYYFDGMGEKVAASLANKNDNNSNHDIFCVNLVTLFSGIRQRADDVLVKESNHIIASSFQNDGGSKTNMNWSSMAFVTNDSELNYKLRRQADPNPSSIRLSRRKRRDVDKKHECENPGTDTPAEGTSGRRKDTSVPMFCDSTGFVDLLSQISLEYNMTMDFLDKEASHLINEAKHCIRECSKSQRRGYNPRREKTWERCVQAETLRRFLCKHATPDGNPPPMQEDRNAVFVAEYLKELQTERDYSTPLKGGTLSDANQNHDSLRGMFMPFLGPSRLDKQQRRQLDRYNALAKKGEI